MKLNFSFKIVCKFESAMRKSKFYHLEVQKYEKLRGNDYDLDFLGKYFNLTGKEAKKCPILIFI